MSTRRNGVGALQQSDGIRRWDIGDESSLSQETCLNSTAQLYLWGVSDDCFSGDDDVVDRYPPCGTILFLSAGLLEID
jgi:hypothetical protein